MRTTLGGRSDGFNDGPNELCPKTNVNERVQRFTPVRDTHGVWCVRVKQTCEEGRAILEMAEIGNVTPKCVVLHPEPSTRACV